MAQNPNPSKLDPGQIIKRVYNEADDRIRVDAEVTATLGEAEVIISQTDDSIRIGDGTDLVTTTTVGSDVGLDVNIVGGSINATISTSLEAGKVTTQDITDTATQ